MGKPKSPSSRSRKALQASWRTCPPPNTVRLDSERSHIEDFRLEQGEQAVHIVTGPAGIAFQAEDQVQSGDFRVEATFVQFDAPVGYREAYGIFVGGRDLESLDRKRHAGRLQQRRV